MKITHNKVGQNINTSDTKSAEQAKATNAKKNAKTSDTAQSQGGEQATNVQLSSRAQDIKKIKEAAAKAPDVDTAKVEKFKKLIAEGKYKVDAKAVAEKMVDEHMKMEKAES